MFFPAPCFHPPTCRSDGRTGDPAIGSPGTWRPKMTSGGSSGQPGRSHHSPPGWMAQGDVPGGGAHAPDFPGSWEVSFPTARMDQPSRGRAPSLHHLCFQESVLSQPPIPSAQSPRDDAPGTSPDAGDQLQPHTASPWPGPGGMLARSEMLLVPCSAHTNYPESRKDWSCILNFLCNFLSFPSGTGMGAVHRPTLSSSTYEELLQT